MSSQTENLDRVSTRIAAAILEFAKAHQDTEFHVEELREYVRNATGIVAPASPDRVLRDLRQRGLLDYVVVSRSASLYRITTGAPKVIVRPAAACPVCRDDRFIKDGVCRYCQTRDQLTPAGKSLVGLTIPTRGRA